MGKGAGVSALLFVPFFLENWDLIAIHPLL